MEKNLSIDFYKIAVGVMFANKVAITRYINIKAKKGIYIFRKKEVAAYETVKLSHNCY